MFAYETQWISRALLLLSWHCSWEKRPAAPFLCTYMGRHSTNGRKPFRFILNHSRAIATNVYLMLYPKPFLLQEIKSRPELATFIWQYLNNLPSDTLKDQGRVYGDGLYKLEPRELANVPIDPIGHVLTKRLTIPSQISLDFA
jgi:adenine-specific DNA-methyltransferase